MTAIAVAMPDEGDVQRLLNKLDCFDHKFGPWREDVEADEYAESDEDDNDTEPRTESRACLECGHPQVRRVYP